MAEITHLHNSLISPQVLTTLYQDATFLSAVQKNIYLNWLSERIQNGDRFLELGYLFVVRRVRFVDPTVLT